MIRSRLNRRIERQNKINFLLSTAGVIIILLSVFKFGIPMLINLSLFLEANKNTQSTKTARQPIFISSPILDPAPYATNSAVMSVSGIAGSSENIELYVNDELTNQTKSQKNGRFIFNNITLQQGQNTIKAKAEKNNIQSDFSQTQTINFTNRAPSLSIDSPADGQSFSKDESPIAVKGKTDPGVKITVNGFWAIVQDNGEFSYELPLTNGDNQIKVRATDSAGNATEKDLKVSFSS